MSDDATLDEFRQIESEEQDGSEWNESKLEDLLSELLTGGRPTGGGLDEGEYISIGGTQVDSEGYIDLQDLVYIPEDYFEKVEKTQLQKHDILVVKDGANTGDVAIAWESDDHIVTNEHLFTLRAESSINSPYLFYFLLSHQGWKQINGTITGSAQEGINRGFTGKVDVRYPPLSEQRKIATVLYTVDQAIEKTSEVIERMETVRRGTEQTLLSRGILEDGSLRDEEQIEHKNSWVGKVPKDWSVQQYSELITDSSVGIVVKPSQYYDDTGEVPILRSKDISRDGIVSGDFEYMTQASNKENSNSRLEADDVITVRSGEPGLSCVVSEEFDGANCADLLISTPGENLDPHYAAMWVNSRAGRKQIDRFQAGLAQKHFNLGALRKMRFAVPEIEEQRRIVEKIGTISESLDREKKYNSQLRRLKRGLMQDLLSGKIRATDTTIEVPEEIAKYG